MCGRSPSVSRNSIQSEYIIIPVEEGLLLLALRGKQFPPERVNLLFSRCERARRSGNETLTRLINQLTENTLYCPDHVPLFARSHISTRLNTLSMVILHADIL